MLPDQVDGVRADYFFITERHMQFFVVLSPDEGKVYASRWFRPKVELAAGLDSHAMGTIFEELIRRGTNPKNANARTWASRNASVHSRAGPAAAGRRDGYGGGG